jgi:tetratricopeptide (TPR) repeat protein
MIARDEAQSLPRALESVKRIADEIVLVDTGSTDDTQALAASLGARVITAEWQDDFSAARNISLANACGEWILCLDADEYVPPEAEAKILAAVSKETDAYFVRIESEMNSAAGRLFVNFVPRLFRNLEGLRFQGRVHEQITPSLERLGAKIEISDIVLKHSGYAISEAEEVKKATRNARLLLEDLASNPDDPLALFHLGEAYSMMKRFDDAVPAYERALKSPSLPREISSVAHQNLGAALIKLKRYEDAMSHLRRALSINPKLLTVHLVLASALFAVKKYDKAEAEILSYIAESRRQRKAVEFKLGREPDLPCALLLLAKCRLAQGDCDKAKEILEDALRCDPDLGDAHLLLARIAFEQARFGAAAGHYEEALKRYQAEEMLYFELSRAYLASGSIARAAQTIEQAIAEGLSSTGLLKCLGVLRIKQHDLQGALSAYEEALALDQDDSEIKRKLAGLYHILGRDEDAQKYLNTTQQSPTPISQ